MAKEDKYILVAFPYPSGYGLHMGHAYSYGIMDSYCKSWRHRGYDVFQPLGFDTHGLPTELYAEKIGKEPKLVANKNIENFKTQLSQMCVEYDIKFSTSDDSYIKWTQWIFTKLKEHGLAYEKFDDVNWCESCKTTLANEQISNNECDRCGCVIQSKKLNSWYFKITEYKDRLINNLEYLDYPEHTKKNAIKLVREFERLVNQSSTQIWSTNTY